MQDNNMVDIRKYIEAFKSLGDAISIQDRDYKVLYQNDAHVEITGLHTGEYCYKAYVKQSHRCDGCPVARTFEKGGIHKAERTGPIDGGHIHVEITSSPIKDAEGNIVAGIEVVRDVTARVHAEEVLERIFNLTPDMICVAGFDGYFKNLNKAWEKALGYTVNELLEKPFIEFVHPDDREKTIQEFETLLKCGETYKFENRYICKDGSSRFLSWNANCAEGNKIYAVARDITSRKKAEEELVASEKKYRLLAENISAVLWTVSPGWDKLYYINSAYEKVWGKTTRSLYDSPASWLDSVVAEDRQKVQETIEGVGFKQMEYVHFPEYRIERPDGEIVWIQARGYPLRNENGEVEKVAGVAFDITPQKKTEEELIQSEQKFTKFVANTTQGVGSLDKEGKIIFVNKSMCEMFGYPEDEMIGKSPVDFLDAENLEIFKNYIATREKGPVKPYEIAFTKKDGSSFNALVSPQVIWDDKGSLQGSFALISDITEHKKLEEERLKVQKLESTGVLAGGIAHDFNNILTAIFGNLSIAKMYAKSDEKITKILNDIDKASWRAKDLAQQLLTFSKGGEPVKTVTRLNELIKDSVALALTGSNVKSEITLEDGLWPAEVDIGQITQVIQNIAKNADQAMPEGGIITVQAENKNITEQDSLPLKDGRYILITIEDHGAGIPDKYLAKIFDPYFSTKQEGSGLGLAASYSIVNKHKGFIAVDSEIGKGSTFYIYLPASGIKARRKDKKAEEQPLKSGEKILIMDDDQEILRIAASMLELMGFKARTATTGQKAVEIYNGARQKGSPFGAVILDLTVPGGMGGMETLKLLRDIDPEVKAIVTSGYADDPVMSDYERYGFKGIVAKPYNFDELGKALRSLFQ